MFFFCDPPLGPRKSLKDTPKSGHFRPKIAFAGTLGGVTENFFFNKKVLYYPYPGVEQLPLVKIRLSSKELQCKVHAGVYRQGYQGSMHLVA